MQKQTPNSYNQLITKIERQILAVLNTTSLLSDTKASIYTKNTILNSKFGNNIK